MTRILVIDDDREVCVLLTRILAREGFDVVEADSGKVALARMREEPFDVVVTDIVMPDTNGIEVITALRRSYPNTKIVGISGGGQIKSSSYLEMASMIGANVTLAKPFTPNELISAVATALSAGSSRG
jgi:CheY-like chemotaxis protein